MKRFRILAATLLLIVLGSAFAFADIAPMPRTDPAQVIAIVVAVVVILVAIVLLRRAVKRRRFQNDGMQPEEPNDQTLR